MIINKGKYRNSICLEMDMYNPGGFIRTSSHPTRFKKYEFELFEEDILCAPLNHSVHSCELKTKIETLVEIEQLIQFLSNLRSAIVSKS